MLGTRLGLNTLFHSNNMILERFYEHDGQYFVDITCDCCNGVAIVLGNYNDVHDCPACKGYGFFSTTLINPNDIIKEIL